MGLSRSDLGTHRVAKAVKAARTTVRATSRAKSSGTLPPPPTVRAPRRVTATRSAPVKH